MAFGGPLKKSKKISVTFSPIEDIEPILRTLGYLRPRETIAVIPLHIKKEVLKLANANKEKG